MYFKLSFIVLLTFVGVIFANEQIPESRGLSAGIIVLLVIGILFGCCFLYCISGQIFGISEEKRIIEVSLNTLKEHKSTVEKSN